MSERPEVEVESYELRPRDGLFINGERFPYSVLADGPMVEPVPDFDMHILWLPLICQGGIAPQGRPEGEPLREPAPKPEVSDARE